MGFFGRIVAAVVGASGLTQELIPETPLWAQFTRIGGTIGPETVTNIIREADIGRPHRLVDLVHECRQKDGHMQAVLGVRELAIAGLKWTIAPPDNPTEEEIKQAAECESALRGCDTLPLWVAHTVGEAALFGFAGAELVWRLEDAVGPLQGRLVVDRFKPISCRRFGFRISDGRIVFIPMVGQNAETDGIDLFERWGPGNFTLYQPRVNGDVPVREGLARVFAWMAILRNWGIRDWLELGEMGWKPWRRGRFTKATSDEADIALLKQALQSLTSTGSCVTPDGAEIEVEWPKATGTSQQSTHKELSGFLGDEMSKAAIGGTLTVDAGVRGARSLGEVHDLVRGDIKEADAKGVAAEASARVVRPFYQFNYGAGVRVGRFQFLTEEGIDLATLADAVQKIAPFVDLPQAWVRGEMGAPDPKNGEPICQQRQPPTPPGGGDDEPSSGGDDEPPNSDEAPDKAKRVGRVLRVLERFFRSELREAA